MASGRIEGGRAAGSGTRLLCATCWQGRRAEGRELASACERGRRFLPRCAPLRSVKLLIHKGLVACGKRGARSYKVSAGPMVNMGSRIGSTEAQPPGRRQGRPSAAASMEGTGAQARGYRQLDRQSVERRRPRSRARKGHALGGRSARSPGLGATHDRTAGDRGRDTTGTQIAAVSRKALEILASPRGPAF